MRCPYCDHPDSFIVDTRGVRNPTGVRRRRECSNGDRYTTYEYASEVQNGLNPFGKHRRNAADIVSSRIEAIEAIGARA